jgi:RsiW-degrading membrane proteinase PrsW (M82 family)
MDNSTRQSSRPVAVTIAVVLLSVTAATGIIKMAVGAHLDNPLTYVVLAVILGVLSLMIWLIFRGKNWARWVFIVLFALGLVLSPRSIQRLQAHSTFDVVFYCIQMLLQLGAAVALCLRPARQWFGGGTNAA